MRNTFLALAILTIFNSASAQQFYEIEWEAGLFYSALVVYYDDSEIDVRVKYNDQNGDYHVAKYSCVGVSDTDDEGGDFFVFDGEDAQIVFSSTDVGTSYIADNFIFTHMDETGLFQDLYTIDDADLEAEDIAPYMTECSFRVLNPEVDFTPQYVYDFFDQHEPEYEMFLSLTTPTVATPPVNPHSELAAPVMHLVIAADIKDRSIGESTKQDMEDITTTFTKIARELGMEIKNYQLYDATFNQQAVTQNLAGINSKANDVVIYYYTGHGYNDTERSSSFPTMALDGTDYGLEEIGRQLQAKNARLTLVIGDMCNSLPQTRSATGSRGGTPFRSGYLFDTDKLHRLFVQSSGQIISTSSQKGEYSFCTFNPDGSIGGGHFTNAFIESMIKETSKVATSTGDWDALFGRAYQKAFESTKNQVNQNGQNGQRGFNLLQVNY